MMAEEVMFYCLRCGHRFPVLYDSKEVKERTCPKCLSNSVRKETPAAIEAREKRGRPA
jgi:predicted  nucleic acid-binding Zn-ribbon protein